MGAPDEKDEFGSIWVVLWSGLGVFWNTLGMFSNALFVGMRLCGCRVFKVISHAMLHGIPVYFGTLQYNSFTRKKTDTAETSSQVGAGMGFSGFMMQPHLFSSTPGSHRISSHYCRPHGSLLDILYDLK